VFLGWNGAASYDRVPAQFPYLISGGVAGLGLMIVGAAVMVVQSHREDRAALQDGLAEVREAIEQLQRVVAGADADVDGSVIAGPTSYHVVGCRLLEGRTGLPRMSEADAAAAGLAPCRVCMRAEPETAAPAKKAPARKAPARKTTTRKAPARKRTTKAPR